jgi:gliding motility-associated protein GldM
MLKEAREEYKTFLLSLDSLGIYEGQSQDSLVQIETRQKYLNLINQLFDTSPKIDPEGVKANQSWQKGRYYAHVPQAALAFMAQDKLDVANIEGSVLSLIQQKTGQSSITVNYQRGIVNSPKQVIMLGDSFNATIFIAGVDTNQLPKFNLYPYSKDGVRIANSSVIDSLDVEGSQGIFSIKPTKQGTYWLGGDILIQSEEGEKTYEFKQQYVVNEAMSVISPDKMNVLYTSVENPVSISVPGYSSDELSLSSNFSQCKVKWKKNGTYIITIPEQRGKSAKKELKLIVKSKATNKAVGEPISFRIKNVPDPIPMVSTIAGYGELSRADLKGTWGVVAKMKD